MKCTSIRTYHTVISSIATLFVFLFCVFVPVVAKADIGPVAQWAMDDSSGNIATDSSGNNNDATINGTASWVSGKNNGALSFDGSSNYGYLSAFTNTPSSEMTLCSWVKTSSATDQVILTFSRTPNSIANEGMFRVLANGSIHFWDYNGSSYGFPYSAPGSSRTVADGRWHLVCFVKNNTTGTYYVDGIQSGTVTALANVSYGSSNWTIGTDYRDHNAYFSGLMDDTRVYNRALVADEIAELYGLVGYWKFDDGSGSTAIDSSGYSNDGMLVGSPIWATGKVGGALHFTGSEDVSIPDNLVLNPTAAITVSAWIRTPTPNSRETFMSKTAGGNNTWLFEIDPSDCGAGKVNFFIVTSGVGHNVCSASALSADTWYNVAATYSSGTVNIYINGILDSSQSLSGAIATNNLPIVIGNWNGGDRPWYGDIDDMRMYSRSLLAEEIASLAATLPGTTTGFTANGTYNAGFNLSWNPNPVGENITDYIVEYSSDSGNTWTAIDTGSTNTTYIVTGLLPGDYFFRVKAVNSVGQGGVSNQVEVNSPPGSYTLGSDCSALQDIANTPGDTYGTYTMSSDINCSGIPNFAPIDFPGGFKGTFNGQGHTITNLTIDTTNTIGYGGLFTNAYGAIFENVNFSIGSLAGLYNLGALVGYIQNTTITGVTSNLSITGTSFALGGIVGQASSSTISNISSSGNISGGTYASGGLIGYVANSTLDHSFATGGVSGDESVGGLVGDASDDGGLDMSMSFYSGTVAGGYSVGGLIGQLNPGSIDARITNCYATGTVTKNLNISDTYNNFGGLVGYANNATIANTYYAGVILGAFNIGGLVGGFSNTSMTDSFSVVSITADTTPTGAVLGDDGGLNGFNGNPALIDVVYDASSVAECDGAQNGISNGCTSVNTGIAPTATYFFNTTSSPPFSTTSPIWDFSSVWYVHTATYPTLRGVGPNIVDAPVILASVTPVSHSGGGHPIVYIPSGGGSGSTGTRVVVVPGITSTEVVPTILPCSAKIYPTKSIKFGAHNDPVQVTLLEKYLNMYEKADLPVDGIYSTKDKAAVILWQQKYSDEILTPWNLAKGTGYIYKTSLNKFKKIFLSQCQK